MKPSGFRTQQCWGLRLVAQLAAIYFVSDEPKRRNIAAPNFAQSKCRKSCQIYMIRATRSHIPCLSFIIIIMPTAGTWVHANKSKWQSNINFVMLLLLLLSFNKFDDPMHGKHATVLTFSIILGRCSRLHRHGSTHFIGFARGISRDAGHDNSSHSWHVQLHVAVNRQ